MSNSKNRSDLYEENEDVSDADEKNNVRNKARKALNQYIIDNPNGELLNAKKFRENFDNERKIANDNKFANYDYHWNKYIEQFEEPTPRPSQAPTYDDKGTKNGFKRLDTGEEDDIDVRIQLTEEQLKELIKEKKEKELRNNIVALRTTAEEVAEAKREAIRIKIAELNNEDIAIQKVIVSISHGEMDEQIIAEELNKKEKTKKQKRKKSTYL